MCDVGEQVQVERGGMSDFFIPVESNKVKKEEKLSAC